MIAALVAAPAGLAAEASSGGLPEWATVIISLIVAGGGAGVITQLMLVRANKRNVSAGTEKLEADATDVLTKSAVSLIIPLREEVARLSAQVKTLEERLVQERQTADTRIRQLEDDIHERERVIRVQGAEIIELRKYVKSAPGWPGA